MRVSTRQDLVAAALAIAEGKLVPIDIEFAEYITDTIKIYSDSWNNAKEIDYKTARLINSVQQDILGIYNSIFKTNITLKNIDKYDFLVVKISIEDGCIQFISKICKVVIENIFSEITDIAKVFSDMTPNQRIATLLILLAIAGAWKSPDIIRAARENPEVSRLLDSNDKVADAVSKNQRTPITIINNLGDGYVVYNGVKTSKDDYEKELAKPKAEDIIPVLIDDEFIVSKYDFENQKVFISKRGEDPFWASTEWLPLNEREKLKDIASQSIMEQAASLQLLNMACKIKGDKVQDATVEGIGRPHRDGATDFTTALKGGKNKSSKPEQASLLE